MAVLSEVSVDIVAAADEVRFRDLMQPHHYLDAVPGMGETARYVGKRQLLRRPSVALQSSSQVTA